MNIAILEDNAADLAELHQYIFDFYREESTWLDSYTNPEGFLSALQTHRYDIVFIDIVLNEENGIDVGEAVNTISPTTDIVFVSIHPEFFQDVYKARHSWFMTKPLNWHRFSEAMTRITLRAENGTVRIQTKQGTERIPISNILYLESNLKHTVFHMKDGNTVDYNVNLADVENQLPDIMFVRIHKSYIVNARDIAKYNSRQVVLGGGINLPIGRTFYASAREKLTRLLAGD